MNTRSRSKMAMAWTLGLLSALGCGGDGDGPQKGELEGSVYAVMYEIYDDVGSNSYLAILDSIDGTVDPKTSREFAGGRAFLQSYNGWIFVGEPTAPRITRYTVNAKGELTDELTMGVGMFGLKAGNLDDWNATFISPTKAYLFDGGQAVNIIWNPTTMEVIGSIPAPPEFKREGLTLESSPAALRGNRLFRTFSWVNYDTAEYSTDLLLGIYDTDTDTLLELVPETRCPVPGNLVDKDEAGNIYFSNWIWPAAGTLMRGAPEACVLRITPDSERFDPSWTFDYGSVAQDRQGAMFSYLRDQKALASIFLDEMTSFDATTDPWAYAGGNFWQIWNVDLATGTGAPLDGIGLNAGAFTPLQFEGRDYLMVPNSDWALTKVFEVTGNSAAPVLDVPGWTYQFKQVR
jgi:hypothetical protein